MAVDLCPVILPVLMIVLLCWALLVWRSPARRKNAAGLMVAAGIVSSLYIGIYFVPGWMLMHRASKNDSNAAFALAHWYLNRAGGLFGNDRKYIAWLSKAAEAGNADAQFELGTNYGYGTLIEQDLYSAMQWLSEAIYSGRADGLVMAQELRRTQQFPGTDDVLIESARRGNSELVSMLLRVGFQPNVLDRRTGQTALMCAADRGDAITVRILLDSGADTMLRDAKGRTAGDIADAAGHADVASVLRAVRDP